MVHDAQCILVVVRKTTCYTVIVTYFITNSFINVYPHMFWKLNEIANRISFVSVIFMHLNFAIFSEDLF
jgi:hypothetical protein